VAQPNRYQGPFVLLIGGVVAGPIHSFNGCETKVVGGGALASARETSACTIEVGTGAMPAVTTWLADAFSGTGTAHPSLSIVRVVGGLAESTIDLGTALITDVSLSVDATETDAAFLSITFRVVHPTPGAFTGSLGSLVDSGFEPSSLQLAISGVGGAGPNKIDTVGFRPSVALGPANPNGYITFLDTGKRPRNTFTIGTPGSQTTSRADLGGWFDTNASKSLTLSITDGGTASLQIVMNQLKGGSPIDFFEREDGRVYMTVNPADSPTDTFTVTFTN